LANWLVSDHEAGAMTSYTGGNVLPRLDFSLGKQQEAWHNHKSPLVQDFFV
jgi:hypothetical protein